MYISELTLQGFKSFADKTKVTFDSGITSIVGPNGCGKSNIVDALRWVLGEQRPSLLRSSAMSNIIFNGTAEKKALGMAEVNLTFVNDKGLLPIEYSEVKITRRLYRSGESEYLINNTPCRLKDIMELFMDTGMSSDAYSVIELKMVEDILSDKNSDRRRLFEEAAGVTRYKDQRKRTFRKLDDTRRDLQRVEDLIIELRKNVRSLERQADKAEKARKYRSELELLDKAYSQFSYNKITSELAPILERIEHADKEKKRINNASQEVEENLEKARNQLIEKEKQQAEEQRLVSQLHNAIRDADTNLRVIKEKIDYEERSIKEYTKDIEQGEIDLKELNAMLQNSREKLDSFDDKLEKAQEILNSTKKQYSLYQQQYNKERHQLYQVEIDLSSTNNELNSLHTKRIKIESRLENTEGDLERLDNEIVDLRDEVENCIGEQGILEKQLKQLTTDRDQLENELEVARNKREKLTDKQNHLKDDIRSLQSKVDSFNSEIRLLKNLADSNEAFPGSVKYLLENHASNFATLTTIAEILNTDEAHAVALEAALEDALNYVVVNNIEDAKKAAQILRDHKKGKATFIPLEQLSTKNTINNNSLAHLVKTDNKYGILKNLLLGNILIFDTVDEIYTELKKGDGFTGVTLKGEVVTKTGFLQSGSKNKNAGIRVGLKDKIEKLEKEESSANQKLAELNTELATTIENFGKIDIELLNQSLKDKEREVRKLDQQKHSLNSKIQVYQKNISELANRKDSLKTNEGSAQDELNSILPRQKELQQKILDLDKQVNQKKDLLESLEEDRSVSQSRYNAAQLEHQDVKNKTENHERDIQRAETGIDGIKSRIENRTKLISDSKNNIEKYKSQINIINEELDQNRALKIEADQSFKKVEEEAAIQRGKINEFEKSSREISRQKEVNMELIHHLSMAKEKMEMQSQTISDYIWDTYGILMKQITEVLPEDVTPDEAKQKITTLRQRLNNIGEVNALAIDEYKEEKERLDFYDEQINDLVKAEEKLLKTIEEVNNTATEQFNTTFAQIRENFQKVFKTLFTQDDYCDLIIEDDAEDPLEARINIIAHPRGKRPSGISQLSGGEKTLTAIALLFAIYLVKPSPFCVLDEVDAPLDDANIERFSNMIKEFSQDTQFIIITHNKMTMSKAEMMYGVTMPVTGVSKLVGVKMDEVA